MQNAPDGYQWHHLKRQVIINTVTKWNELVEILQPHVDKTDMSYQEICEHFARVTNKSRIPHGARDFMIFATRLFLDEPIVIIKPSICTKGRQENNEYVVEKCFINDEDKCLDKDEFNIIMVWNGLYYYAPAMEAMNM